MSFLDSQTGIETYTGGTKLVFPHPPIILERFAGGAVEHVVGWSIDGTPIVVQWPNAQASGSMRLLVRRLTSANMATLEQLRDATGLLYVKIAAGVSTKYLAAFGPLNEQVWKPMVADHPETTEAGGAIPSIFLVYEAEINLILME